MAISGSAHYGSYMQGSCLRSNFKSLTAASCLLGLIRIN